MEDHSGRIRSIVEYALLAATAVTSIVIAILDLLGLLDNNSWLSQRIPTLILLGVGLVASYLVLERRGKLDEIATSISTSSDQLNETIEQSFSNAVRALDGTEVRVFDDGADFISYFISRIRSAKRVDDITWSNETPTTSGRELETYERFQKAVSDVAAKPHVTWREIVMFVHPSRVQRIKRRLADNIPGYSVVYYEVPAPDTPPRQTFAIVDGQEVFLASYKLRLAVRQPDIVAFFADYYEACWQGGRPLKIGQRVFQETIDMIEKKSTSQATNDAQLDQKVVEQTGV